MIWASSFTSQSLGFFTGLKKNRPLQKSTYLRTGMRIKEMTSAWYGAWDLMQLHSCPSLSPTAGPSSCPVLRFPQPPVTGSAGYHLFLPSLLRLSSGEPPLRYRRVFPQPSAHPAHPMLLPSICAPVSPSDWERLEDRAHLTHLRAARVHPALAWPWVNPYECLWNKCKTDANMAVSGLT